ncbi:antitoxin Xre-like helix-turn-helix domain-containing protein [Croceicoccus marinus]|uniref:Uncharacterized protein n=1 Tax=Croceicoccus marinus TaxID=450378 RepID=A0A1Z1FDL5_9SPHN|nr:hypothetical protein A9D14_12545 [Croceicoccus marinus]
MQMLRYFPVMAPEPPSLRVTKEEAHTGARAIVRLFDAWGLSDRESRELLGGIGQDTWLRWKSNSKIRISRDLGTRLGLLLSIHNSLRIIYHDKSFGNAWVRKSNEFFQWRTPLDVMMSGTIFSMARVRNYLLAECS